MVVKEQKKKISIDVAQFINDYNLYKQGRDLLKQLKPFSKRLNILQKDFARAANSYSIWMTSLKKRHSNISLLKKESGFEAIPLFSISCIQYTKEKI